ncbi:hypothetical protein WCE14_13030 [Acinetobacter schindleri]|uniref:hypothetical protein n=1 Tax=Acinetobacter TaxID=469 RepID=UPI0008F4602C|nr:MULTISPECIES: hypothetical protein [Acinetobacter]OIJ39145.1 hypothetical protein BK820_02350 [Acinetobacter sp. LCT-H3]
MKKTLLAFTVCAFLTACGGSDNDSSSSQPNSPSSKTGILTDGPIARASYTINGETRYTNADGEFEYQEGDEITFKIGDIEIGTVLGAERITPLELTNNPDIRTNLLIFLQSLDIDGNHDNGIELPENLSSLSSTEIDFTLPTDEFIEILESELSAVPGLENSVVVTPEQAKENFKKSLLKDIAGIWYVQSNGTDESEIALVIEEDGRYTMGEAVLNEPENEGNGIEVGSINLDPVTGKFTVETSLDTNDDWGLHDPYQPRTMSLQFNGKQLRIEEADNAAEGATFSRVSNNTSGIIGVWEAAAGPIFVFNANNTYFMLDPVGDELAETEYDKCGDPGIEFGNYTIENNILHIDNIIVDTNGCAGLSDNGATEQGLSLTFQDGSFSFTIPDEGTFTLKKIN